MSKPYKARIPEGKRGDWEVSKFTLTKRFCSMLFIQELRDIRDCGQSRKPKPGRYTRLTRKGVVIMSDTPAELNDLKPMCEEVYGDVLIHGLGLGIAVDLCLAKGSGVRTVVVIENDLDVIKLVAPTLKKRYGTKLTIIEEDAFNWKPSTARFDCIWSDIWSMVGSENLPGMAKLKRMWRSRCGWHGFWCQAQCRHMARYA